MSEQSTTTTVKALTPAETRILAIWDSLPENERNYANVAERYTKADGSAITEQRAGVYVRDVLRHQGRENELPRRGLAGGAGRPRKEAPGPEQAMRDMLDVYDEQIERFETALHDAEAQVNVSDEDAKQLVEDEIERLEAVATEARKVAQAFKKNTDDAHGGFLAERAEQAKARVEKLRTQNEQHIDSLREKREQAQRMLSMVEQASA